MKLLANVPSVPSMTKVEKSIKATLTDSASLQRTEGALKSAVLDASETTQVV